MKTQLQRWRSSEFLRHVLQLMTGTALAQVIPVLAMLVMSRYFYSPAEIGVFTVLLSVVQGLVTLSALRYDLAIVLPKSEADAKRLFWLCTRINATVSVTAAVVFWLFGPWAAGLINLPQLGPWLVLAAPIAFATEEALIVGYWLNRRKQFKQMAINKVTLAVGASVSQLALGFARMGVFGLVVGQFVGAALAMATIWRRVLPELRAVEGEPRPRLLREYRHLPLLNGPNALADAIRVNGINALIARYFTGFSLGQFGLAWRLLQAPLALINGALAQVFFQRLSVTQRGDMSRVVRASIGRSALIGVLPFGLIYFLAPPLFPVILGNQWAQAGQIAALLVPWLYLNLITSPISTVFIVVRSQLVLLPFAAAFTATPLALIAWRHDDILETMTYVSWSMAGLLVVFALLAVWVSHRFDSGEAERNPEAVEAQEAGA